MHSIVSISVTNYENTATGKRDKNQNGIRIPICERY